MRLVCHAANAASSGPVQKSSCAAAHQNVANISHVVHDSCVNHACLLDTAPTIRASARNQNCCALHHSLNLHGKNSLQQTHADITMQPAPSLACMQLVIVSLQDVANSSLLLQARQNV